MSLWDPSDRRDDDRWSRPCTRCSGTGSVLRYARQSCGCLGRCSAFCPGKIDTMVTKDCTHCNGRGIEPY